MNYKKEMLKGCIGAAVGASLAYFVVGWDIDSPIAGLLIGYVFTRWGILEARHW